MNEGQISFNGFPIGWFSQLVVTHKPDPHVFVVRSVLGGTVVFRLFDGSDASRREAIIAVGEHMRDRLLSKFEAQGVLDWLETICPAYP